MFDLTINFAMGHSACHEVKTFFSRFVIYLAPAEHSDGLFEYYEGKQLHRLSSECGVKYLL